MRKTSILAALLAVSVVFVGVAGAQTVRDHRASGISRPAQLPDRLAPPRNTGGPGVIYAGTSLRCGSTIYHVSVNGGTCGNQTPQRGGGKGCSNASGDYASANCTTGCGDTKGSGDCTITVAPQ